jgi:C4-dicarboxylate-binding protein DctP
MAVAPAIGAGKTIIKVPVDSTPDFPSTKAWQVLKQYVESKTGGAFEIQIHHSAQLGDSQKAAEATKMGIYKLTQHDNGISGFYPPMAVWQIPYLFADETVCFQYFKSEAFQELNNKMAKEIGLRILGANPFGFFTFLNKKRPITKLEDLKGLKMRTVPGIEIEIEVWKALGISPTPTSWGEIYTSLKTGVIDGVPHAILVHDLAKFYEVAKYLTVDFSFAGITTYEANEQWWQSLSPEHQSIFRRGFNLALYTDIGGNNYRNRVSSLEVLKKNGVNVTYLSPGEKERIKKAAQAAAIEFLSQKVDKATIDKTLKVVEEINQNLSGNK